MRRYFAAGIWLVLTLTATVMVWEAVSVVAADVTDRPAPVVASHDVAVALQATTTTVPATAAPTPPPPTVTTTPAHATTPKTSPPTTVPITVAPTPTTQPVFTPSTTSVPSQATTVPTTAPTTPSGATATFSTPGGSVLVACTGAANIRLVAALPADGYQAVVVIPGPNLIALTFLGQGHNYPLGAACAFGQPYPFNSNSNIGTFP